MRRRYCLSVFGGILLFILEASVSFGALPHEYAKEQRYDFSEKELLLLNNLGELSAVEEAFVDCLSLRIPEERHRYLLRYALDGQVTVTEYQQFCEMSRKIPREPAEILEALMSSVNREYFVHTFKDRRFKLSVQLKHWRKDPKGRFDDPLRALELMDQLFLWMDCSPDYYAQDRSYEEKTEVLRKKYGEQLKSSASGWGELFH